jgi:hypothetical protein
MLDGVSNPIRKVFRARRLMRRYGSRYGVTGRRQLLEMSRLWMRNGIGPLEYYLMGLFRPWVPWEEKLNTVSQATYWKLIQVINPPQLRTIATNKLASYGMLRSFGIPTPTVHGVLGPSGRTTDGEPLCNMSDLGALVAARSLSEICFKPFSAWSGRGFVKVRFGDDPQSATVVSDGKTVSLEQLRRDYLVGQDSVSYLVQEAIEQHPEVARLHPPSVNTVRQWMYQREEGVWEMGPGNLRIGVGGSVVDNTSAGGIGAAVDAVTGRLSRAVLRGLDPDNGVYHEEYAAHPTTGETIEGVDLPMWDEVRELCQRTCEVFPFFGLMGLDIAFGVDHPWIIEVEADPHAMIQVYVGRGIMADLYALARRAQGA